MMRGGAGDSSLVVELHSLLIDIATRVRELTKLNQHVETISTLADCSVRLHVRDGDDVTRLSDCRPNLDEEEF